MSILLQDFSRMKPSRGPSELASRDLARYQDSEGRGFRHEGALGLRRMKTRPARARKGVFRLWRSRLPVVCTSLCGVESFTLEPHKRQRKTRESIMKSGALQG